MVHAVHSFALFCVLQVMGGGRARLARMQGWVFIDVILSHAGKVVFQSPAFWQKYAMQPSYQQTEWHPLSDYKSLKD